MAITYRIDPKQRIVFSTGRGVYTKQDVEKFVATLTADPDFEEHFSHYFDLTAVDVMDLSANDIESIARYAPFGSESRQAFVSEKDEVFGLLRMFQAMREQNPGTIGVFRSEREALKWLGIKL